MARLWMSGAEIRDNRIWDALSDAGTPPVADTTHQRSGAACWACASGAGNAISSIYFGPALSTSATNYLRFYVNAVDLPASTIDLVIVGLNLSIKILTDGTLQVWNLIAAAQIGTTSGALGSGYKRLELKMVMDSNMHLTAVEAQLEGSSFGVGSGLDITLTNASTPGGFEAGWCQSPGANKTLYIDDLAINDSSGGSQNTWPGSGKVVLLKPTADSARGVWTVRRSGANATTNVYLGVANTIPIGEADPGTTDNSMIRAVGAAPPYAYDATMTTYTAAGIGSSDTINAIQAVAMVGQSTVTGDRTIDCSIVSNPAVAADTAVNPDTLVSGTFPTGWIYARSVVDYTDVLAANRGTAPVARVRAVSGTTSSRAIDACFLGIYVDYTPPTPVGLYAQPCNLGNSPGLMMDGAAWMRHKARIAVPRLWLPEPPAILTV